MMLALLLFTIQYGIALLYIFVDISKVVHVMLRRRQCSPSNPTLCQVHCRKHLNASKPSEHPPDGGGKCQNV